MPESHGANDDLKAQMREALDRKKAHDQGVPEQGPTKEKAHGSEVVGGGAPKMNQRRADRGGRGA